jgi:acyl-coenzyme A synthetase/AMP-(fatty) acid ligase
MNDISRPYSVLPAGTPATVVDGSWVDEVLLAGPPGPDCLILGEPVSRGALRRLVADRQNALRAAGLRSGGSLAVCLPPSIAYIANLLAGWRCGAQVAVLDYRLTAHEVQRALQRLRPQLVVCPVGSVGGPLRAWFDVTEAIEPYAGEPAATGHALIQLSSGSTGPSKVIARTAADLVAEIGRYTRIAGMAGPGERAVVLASVAHVLGLVGGLLYSLHAGARMEIPDRLTVDAILRAVRRGNEPATLIGVPAQAEILAGALEAPAVPQLARMITGGEPVRTELWQRFTDIYGTTLGSMYGMTEVGVIATDIFGEHRPALTPAPGLHIVEQAGELLVARDASPYLGLADPTRFVDGWLHTRDAGEVNALTGRIVVHGRLDSQVSIGGLKVDLAEVEQAIAGVDGVTGAVVVYDNGIRVYLTLADGVEPAAVDTVVAAQLAAYKRPRTSHVLPQLPRTTSGKPVRDPVALRAAAQRFPGRGADAAVKLAESPA